MSSSCPSVTWYELFSDNLLSPIRDTTFIERSDSVNSESPASQVKLPSTMEVTVSSPADIADKENIEPSAAVAKEHTSTLQQMDYKSTVNPSIIDAPQREKPPTACFPQEAIVNSPSLTLGRIPQGHPLTPKADSSTRCESSSSPDVTQRLTLPTTNSSSIAEEGSKGTNSSICSHPAMVTSPASQVTMSLSTPSKLSPPKKRQLLRPVQASDLAPETPPPQPEAAATSGESCGHSGEQFIS